MDLSRIESQLYRDKVISAEKAASFIENGMTLAIPHFICFDNPIGVAGALLERRKKGEDIVIDLVAGAACAPIIDMGWTEAGMVRSFMPYTSANSGIRKCANATDGLFFKDYRLSVIPEYIKSGYLGDIDIALVSVAGITEDGKLKPSICAGYSQTVLTYAKKVILEINVNSSADMYLLHDIYDPGPRPGRQPIPITKADDAIGSHFYTVDPDKVLGVVITTDPLFLSPMWKPFTADEAPEEIKRMAHYFVDFMKKEIEAGRMPKEIPPIQTGGGLVAGTVLREMGRTFGSLDLYTEAVLEDGMQMLDDGSIRFISTAGFGCSGATTAKILENPKQYEGKLMVRPLEISNHPEVIRRLGILALNNIVEADIYGNINSTHVNGTSIISGIGGALDFAQNAALTCYFTLSTAKGGKTSCIVPSCSHVDITEHEVNIIVTEYGIADLRNKGPRERVKEMIAIAHPDYRPMLQEYYDKALATCAPNHGHTPHCLEKENQWHIRARDTGTMMPE